MEEKDNSWSTVCMGNNVSTKAGHCVNVGEEVRDDFIDQ